MSYDLHAAYTACNGYEDIVDGRPSAKIDDSLKTSTLLEPHDLCR